MRGQEYMHAISLMDAPNTGYVRADFYTDDAGLEMIDYDDTFELFADGSVTLVSTPAAAPHPAPIV